MNIFNEIEDTETFGLVFADFDLLTLNPSQANSLQECLARRGVVVFRRQALDDAGFVRVMQILGSMMVTPGEQPLPKQPLLNAVSNVARTRAPRSVFHTDSSYLETPPAYTGLRAVLVPRSGGETVFSNQYAAADELPRAWRAALTGRTLRHRATGVAGRIEECWHPILRRHPLTGRTALFLSTPDRCDAISGVTPDVGQRMVQILYQRSIRQSQLFRHAWSSGDVAIWDNRCTMHRAIHESCVGDRVLHRGMVVGETPIACQ